VTQRARGLMQKAKGKSRGFSSCAKTSRAEAEPRGSAEDFLWRRLSASEMRG